MLLPRENTFRSLRQLFRDSLTSHYDQPEADAICRTVVEEILHVKWSHLLLDQRFSESDINKVSSLLQELTTGRPMQYVLGFADFLGCRLKVDGRVLIPRPETEELCELILRHNDTMCPLTLLDIGTGSGCIPVALKRHAPAWEVSAMDVDSGALALAQDNADANGTPLIFHQMDVLRTDVLPAKYDIIVSNPPYVAEEEQAQLMDHVLVHEPHLALFVPDADTLLFYRAITKLAAWALNPGGQLWLELNERFGSDTAALVRGFGFAHVEVLKDLSGKDRFVTAVKQ